MTETETSTSAKVFDCYQSKIILDYNVLSRLVEAYRTLGRKIVLTIGSWDLLHPGHVRYLVLAKSFGEVLVVGVDSDAAIKRYKGPTRPLVQQEHRMEMLSYQECVDLVTDISDVDQNGYWHCGLIRFIRPDVYVAVEDSYSLEQRKEIKKFCGDLVVLSRQATDISTTDLIQNVLKKHWDEFLHQQSPAERQ